MSANRHLRGIELAFNCNSARPYKASNRVCSSNSIRVAASVSADERIAIRKRIGVLWRERAAGRNSAVTVAISISNKCPSR